MDIQNCLLCILYSILIIAHSFTLTRRDFHLRLISVFSLALLLQTIFTILVTFSQVNAQLLHVTSINLLILFLLIVAKGWPITRPEMPYKYAFATFWFICLIADLINSYWTNIRLSLAIRIVSMLYFLLELRKTMVLEQEQGKLQFYLHFGALSMVWFIHSVIVYAISLRVDKWQGKLISGFSSAADFLAFAVTTRLLLPLTSRSHLFREPKIETPTEIRVSLGSVS